ncbi:hypothetical protein GCM10009654_61200 [Streptomyces hebeiensis]|uniref:Uncharacterized protein n=1 Tax=Streptomyces hebeiensis TaxID=229486 RepID=A0ABN1V8V7_9ACTN
MSELVDAFGQVPGVEGVELLSKLVLDGLPHPVPVFPQGPDLLPGEFEFCAQRCCGAPGTRERGDGGLPTLLCGFDVLADAFGVGEPCRDAGGAGDRGVGDLLALPFQCGDCGQGSLAFVEAGAAAGLGEGVRVAVGFMPGRSWRGV